MANFRSVGGAFGLQRKVMAARLASAGVRPLTQEERFWNDTQREWDERIVQLSTFKPADIEVTIIRRKR